MKVCVIMHVEFKNIFNKVAHEFIQNGHEVVFLAWTHFDEERAVKEFPNHTVYSPARYMEENWDCLDLSELASYQEKYPKLSFWDIYYTERRSRVLNKEEAAKYLLGYAKLFEGMYQTEQIDLIVTESLSEFTFFMAKYIGYYFGVQYLGFVGSAFHPHAVHFTYDETFCFPRVTKLFCSDHSFHPDEMEEARRFIQGMVEKQAHAPAAQVIDKVSNQKFFQDFLALPRYWRKMIFRRKDYFNKYDYPLYKMKERYSRLYLRWFRWQGSKKYFEPPRYESESYYLFPLHYIPEAVVLASSRKYADQTRAIEQLARVLPAGTMLYVKEHYTRLGHKPISFYEKIAHLQNVRIISPMENTHTLIKNSRAVVTLASTVGIEALMHGIPTYVLGNIYYDCIPSVTKIRDIFDEQEKFRHPKPVSRDEVVRFICAMFHCEHEGDFIVNTAEYISEENAKKLYQALVEEYGYRKGL